ncbi:TonB-dependent receptor [Sphingopyxis terrae]|jgi:iron complex outermembrane receptor protein|uniref:TonB-dependent receptor n=1 Tax=Sphingopyxis terrae TaxID=33052 RepID=UPI003F7E52EB
MTKGMRTPRLVAVMNGTAAWTALAVASLLVAPAAAQEASTDQADKAKASEDEEIIVTGYAASIARALANKRSADVISDGIAAEDIGKYPEQNIAESLQRVTGVQITRNLGEGQFLSVRGLDPKFTNTLYNGRQVPSASGTRAFDFQVLTSNFASRVDVYKSPSADLIESGLAATVNMQTIEPLAIGGRKISLSAEGNYDQQLDGGLDPHVSALYSDVFAGGKLGVSLAVDISDRKFNSQNFSTDGVVPDGTFGGPGTQYRVFGLHQNDLIGSNRRRSGTAMIQFRPTDNLEIKLDGIYSWLAQRYDMYQGNNWYTGAGALGPSPTASSTVDADGVQTAWRGTNVFSWVQANRYAFVQEMYSTALSGALTLDKLRVTGEVSYGRAVEKTTQTYVSWATRSPGASLYYDAGVDPGGPFSFGFYNDFNPMDPANYYFFGVQGSYKQPTTDRIWNGKIDATREFDSGMLRAIRFGVNFQDRRLTTTPNNMTNSAVGLPADMTGYLTVHRNPNYFSSYDGPAQFPRTFLTVDLDSLFADYPLDDLVALNPPQQALTRTTSVRERSQAGYVRLDLASSDDQFKMNVGARIVRTDQASSGYIPAPGATLVYGLFGGPNSLSYTAADVLAQKHDYTYVLPSLNARYQIGNDLLVRFAAARVMQRPDMNLLGQASSPNASSGPPPVGTTWRGTLTQGNPNLKPYLSDQLDLSFEWYFGKQSMLGAALFLKDVKNLVLTNYSEQVADVTLYGTGEVRPITLSVAQPVNAESTTIKGAEVGYQQSLDFLPGFLSKIGVRANWTHIWYGSVVLNQGSPAVPLTGISKDTYNLGAYYDDGTFSLHAGYNYRSRWVQDPLSFFGDGIFTEGYGQLDLAANYRINSNLSVNAWVINATESALRQTNRYGVTRLYELSGRRFTVGVRANF